MFKVSVTKREKGLVNKIIGFGGKAMKQNTVVILEDTEEYLSVRIVKTVPSQDWFVALQVGRRIFKFI